MNRLSLADIERELLDIADAWDKRERLFSLARRLAVQIETDKLGEAA